MMRQYPLRPATWVIALFAVMSLGAHRLSAWDWGVFFGIGADRARPFAEERAVPGTPDQEQPEVLSRGPVHEAFAEPVVLQSQPPVVAPERPPPNIEEIPPAERPRGEQFVWIPGYWSWDTERYDYIWVSACWRVPPPKMSWVSGYWSEGHEGWEWISGFWTPAGVLEIEYLPAPPTPVDVEPYGPREVPDTIWVPPCMYWVHGQYVRRAGYWLAAQQDWVWVPSHYVSTPRGYIFADAHWDYPLERRGMLFAPVYFPTSVHRRRGFTFSPSIVIDIGLLRRGLFAYPRYSHYYFGDYYDDAYLSIGIYPWFDSHRLRTWYDPVFEHDRWRHQRSEPRWEERARETYNRRRADKSLRPARTYREQESHLTKLPERQRQASRLAQPASVAVTSRETPLRFERIDGKKRHEVSKQATAVRTFRDERNRWESITRDSWTARDHRGTATPHVERRDTTKSFRDHRGTVTPPVERGEPVQPPRRELNLRQPERVRIPAPPIVGNSGSRGIFRRGLPARPTGEDKGKSNRRYRGADTPRNRATDRNTRKDRNTR